MTATWTAGPASGSVDTLPNPFDIDAPESLGQRRYYQPKTPDRIAVTEPEIAADVLMPHFDGLDREACIALYLDTKHRVQEVELVSLGSIDKTFMSPREIFRGALLLNTPALVIAHNHPSGDPEPSEDDVRVTRRIVRAGEIIGVDVLDHLVIGGQSWVSLARRGHI